MVQIPPDRLKPLIDSIDIPPRPDTMIAIMQMLNSQQGASGGNLTKLISLISQDQALSASVLKLVNSAAYSLPKKISNIQQAINILGMKTVSKLIMEFSLKEIGSVHPDLVKSWNHSVRTARIAGFLGQKFGVTDGSDQSEAYLFGLFHDCGATLMWKHFPDDYQETLDLASVANSCLFEIENQRHQTNHATEGAKLAEAWNLSDNLRQAILLHHQANIFSDPSVSNEIKTLIAIGHLALCIENAHCESPSAIIDNESMLMAKEIIDFLNISWTDLDNLYLESKKLIENINDSVL